MKKKKTTKLQSVSNVWIMLVPLPQQILYYLFNKKDASKMLNLQAF